MEATRTPGPITMYGADWCGDCRRAKAWFDGEGISYSFVDLVAHPDETDVVLERNGGAKRIPLIVFADDTHLTEPTDAELEAKVAELAGQGAVPQAEPSVLDDEDSRRFELRTDEGDLLSFADYHYQGETMVIPYVETLPEHRGQGRAEELMAGIVENLRSTGRSVTPLCPYAAGYLRDRPETHDVLTRRS